MPLTKWQASKIISGKRAAPKRTPEQQAARDKIAAQYKRDKMIECVTCGYMRNHVWDGSQFVCGCGTANNE